MRPYPKFRSGDQKDIESMLEYIRQERVTDVADFTNLPNILVSGRTVARVPSAFNDVLATDRIGDINWDYTTGYVYRLVDNAGTAVWARIALDTSW